MQLSAGGRPQIQYLEGIKYLYQLDIFLYCMMGFVLLTFIYLFLKGPLKWKRLSAADREAAAYAA